MAKKKRNVLDNLNERIDEMLKELERLLQGNKKERALVPIPVRNDDAPRHRPKRHPYEY